ncbi:uncharacterized protein BO72DRAFT_448490 [Aspergillus fijiensis CBS 313.89]|uniref:Uncharacterized protein n=1 Tax=Aspergillus fijiensis CBS 313.89 TaxID=1448319 RepID=A0A8G1RSN1_9EURO|nr:uncharacterized protein BO72DRAFT_448490 [Aspergillus fijiensis CBS 313.89]RAK76796.1 hypothetical protein BO72DRAFT_448490 [Aspergillus fijiensis CBS 313.89]
MRLSTVYGTAHHAASSIPARVLSVNLQTKMGARRVVVRSPRMAHGKNRRSPLLPGGARL